MRVELYPVFAISLHFDRFYNIDISDREFYQIRFKLKTPVFCKPEIIYERASCPNVIYPPCVFEGYGVSKTVEVTSELPYTSLDDCFRCTVQVLRRFDLIRKLSVQLVIELFVLDHSHPPKLESFSSLTKRTVDISLRLDKTLHVHRPVFFDSLSFAAVSMTVHSSLVSVIPVRKKLPPDPPTSEKLCQYYKALCSVILSTKSSLQTFIRRYSAILSSPLHIDDLDVQKECLRYEKEFSQSQNGWATLEQDAAILSRMISQLFAQLVQMFSRSSQLSSTLHEEFDQIRMKRLGELFLFSESPMQSLEATESSSQTTSHIIDTIKKSLYFFRMPKMDFYCSGTDVGLDNRTIIIEERFLPPGTVEHSLADFTEVFAPEVSVLDMDSPKRNNSLQNCVGSLCLPLKCASSDEPYAMNPSDSNFLRINNDRLNLRRMTDPGVKFEPPKDSGTGVPLSLRRSIKNRKTRSSLNLTSLPDGHEIERSASAADASVEENNPLVIAASSSSSSSSASLNNAEKASTERQRSRTKSSSIEMRRRCAMTFDDSFLQFLHNKEHLKEKLRTSGFQGYFYSDLAHFPYRVPYFSIIKRRGDLKRTSIHLVVLVHGLEGSTEDLVQYRNSLRLLLPEMNLKFLPSRVNRQKTWTSLDDLASNLLYEVLDEIKRLSIQPKKISFIAHSMGGLIIRAMFEMPAAQPLIPLLNTFLTLNTPHCGLLYNQRPAKWGVSIMRWWKQSDSLQQLCLRDAISFRNTFLYKLSTNKVLGYFKYVLLVGSCQDLYVPLHSAIITRCKYSQWIHLKASDRDQTTQGTVYDEMVSNLNESIVNSPVHTTLVKYTVYHSFTSNVTRAYQVTGKAAHIAVIDDDVFIERLLAVSAAKYFV